MKNPVRIILFTFLLILAIDVFSQDAFSQDKIRWYTIEQAEKLNGQNPKKIFIDVYTDWCGWCKRMDATTYQDPSIIQLLNDDFYAVRLDAEQKNDIVFKNKSYKFIARGSTGYNELAAVLLNGQLSYPTTVYLDENLNEIQPIPGYLPSEKLEPILKFLGKDYYKKQTWEQFLAQNYHNN